MRKTVFLLAIALAATLFVVQGAAASSDDDTVKIRRIEMSISTATVRVNQQRTLYVEFFPYNATNQTLDWESSNYDVVEVDGEGVITGISPGTAEITATAHNRWTTTCTVTVPGAVLPEIDQDVTSKDSFASEIEGGELISAAKLRVDVEAAVRAAGKGETAVLTYKDKSTVTTSALRSAAFTAEYEGGAVSLKFQTTKNNGKDVQGQLTIDPTLVGEGEADVKLGVYTATEAVQQAAQQAQGYFGKDVAAVQLTHSGEFGMQVEVAARVDFTGNNGFVVYRYSDGVYQKLEQQNCWLDANGYIHFTTPTGGTFVVVPQA